jgi:hypothetical protein
MSDARHIHGFVLLVTAALALAGCGSTVDMVPEKLGGLPSGAPQRPATTLPTPNVYEVRPTREAKPLTDAEQQKLESDLLALRETEKQRANPPPPPPPPPEKKAATKPPAGHSKAPASPAKGAAKTPAAAKKPAEPMKLAN